MKKKSLILLPLLVLGSTGLSMLVTSCDKPVKSIAFEDTADITVKVGKTSVLPTVTVLPENATDKSYTVVTSAANIAEVSYDETESLWVVKGIAPGEATISAIAKADQELKATLKVTVPQPKPIPAPVVKTVAEIIAMDTTDTQNLYSVTGYITSVRSDDKYGNMTIVEEVGGPELIVYGSTLSKDCIKWNDAETELKFSNPKDFVTGGLGSKVAVGDKVTLECLYTAYGDDKKDEIMGYVLEESIVKANTMKDKKITLNNSAAGTAEWVKKTETGYEVDAEVNLEALYWGQELLLKATPTEQNYAAVVEVDGQPVLPNEDGIFAIVVQPNAKVKVTYEKQVPGLYEMTPDHFGLYGSYTNTTGKIRGVSLATFHTANYGDGIQMRKNTKGTVNELSNVYNTTELDGAITQVKITFNKNKLKGSSGEFDSKLLKLIVSPTKVELSANGTPTVDATTMEVKDVNYVKDSGQYTVTFTFEAAKGYKYFDITHIDAKGTVYLTGIEVTTSAFVAPEA